MCFKKVGRLSELVSVQISTLDGNEKSSVVMVDENSKHEEQSEQSNVSPRAADDCRFVQTIVLSRVLFREYEVVRARRSGFS